METTSQQAVPVILANWSAKFYMFVTLSQTQKEQQELTSQCTRNKTNFWDYSLAILSLQKGVTAYTTGKTSGTIERDLLSIAYLQYLRDHRHSLAIISYLTRIIWCKEFESTPKLGGKKKCIFRYIIIIFSGFFIFYFLYLAKILNWVAQTNNDNHAESYQKDN